jgi:peroxiredoxin
MKKIFGGIAIAVALVSCKGKGDSGDFVVKGKITNNSAHWIYLEEMPMVTMQRVVVDSAQIDKNGNYSLKAKPKESNIYSLRLDQNSTPVAQVVNDVSKITVNVTFNKGNAQFPEEYEVKGSEGSQLLKDFTMGLNKKLQEAFENGNQIDSLRRVGTPDSVLMFMTAHRQQIATEMRGVLDSSVKRSKNPAVTILMLGSYISTANNPAFNLIPIGEDEVVAIINDLAAKYPAHQGIAAIKQSMDAQSKKASAWVGQTAPEISLPDVNGKVVTLSSFKGKYVLVDFWASWCKPCRAENPNIVSAFNKYRNKNFTILGVSLDREKDDWLKAIRDDKLTWTHISDLQYWGSAVVPLYAIEGIPFNVLVDPQGKIVAQGLRGEGLEEKLAEVLK